MLFITWGIIHFFVLDRGESGISIRLPKERSPTAGIGEGVGDLGGVDFGLYVSIDVVAGDDGTNTPQRTVRVLNLVVFTRDGVPQTVR